MTGKAGKFDEGTTQHDAVTRRSRDENCSVKTPLNVLFPIGLDVYCGTSQVRVLYSRSAIKKPGIVDHDSGRQVSSQFAFTPEAKACHCATSGVLAKSHVACAIINFC